MEEKLLLARWRTLEHQYLRIADRSNTLQKGVSHRTERILVPVDGSEPATQALDYALTAFPDAELTALHVVPAPYGYWETFAESEDDVPVKRQAKDNAESVLVDARNQVEEHDRDIETAAVTGKPARKIIDHADNEGFDIIVIGSHGRDGVERVLLGSISEKIVRRSPVPVLVVR